MWQWVNFWPPTDWKSYLVFRSLGILELTTPAVVDVLGSEVGLHVKCAGFALQEIHSASVIAKEVCAPAVELKPGASNL